MKVSRYSYTSRKHVHAKYRFVIVIKKSVIYVNPLTVKREIPRNFLIKTRSVPHKKR
jgi:hypothetical protein